MLIITIEVIALILVNRVVEALSDKSYKDELTDLFPVQQVVVIAYG